MNKIYGCLLFALISCNNHYSKTTGVTTSENNTLSNSEKRDGWQLLFDGSTTSGWHTYGKTRPAASWQTSDGTLMLNTDVKAGEKRDGGDLITDQEFENYHLQLDWKISVNGNSGVIFNVKEDPAQYHNTYETGPEMQVLDNNGHPDAKIHKHRAGDLYDLIASAKETVKPAGEWNHAELMLNRGKLEFWLNGEKSVSTTMWDNNWNTMVANSKFKSMPGFGKFKQGHVALQDHGNTVWFRNIKIKRL